MTCPLYSCVSSCFSLVVFTLFFCYFILVVCISRSRSACNFLNYLSGYIYYPSRLFQLNFFFSSSFPSKSLPLTTFSELDGNLSFIILLTRPFSFYINYFYPFIILIIIFVPYFTLVSTAVTEMNLNSIRQY